MTNNTTIPTLDSALSALTIRIDDLSSADVQALLAYHLQQMHTHSPAECVFALDLSGLQKPEITVWSAWRGAQIVAVGALKASADGTGELKSMRTHPDYLRQGAAAILLDHIISIAQQRGMTRLSLETGRGPAFDAALTLYRKRGFTSGAAFADYLPNPFSQYFHLAL